MNSTIKDRFQLEPDEKLFSKKQAADVFCIHYRTLERWINARYLTPIRVGGRVYISSNEIQGIFNVFVHKKPNGNYLESQIRTIDDITRRHRLQNGGYEGRQSGHSERVSFRI